MSCFLVDFVVGLGKGWTPHTPFLYQTIVKLYVISDDGRKAAVAELSRADKLEDEVKEGEFQRWFWRERNDLNGGDKEKMMSLGDELVRGHNEMKEEIDVVMLEGI